MMTSDSDLLARSVAAETGLACNVRYGVDEHGDSWSLLTPVGVDVDHAFAVRTTIRWRRVVVAFEPGKFAGDLLAAMGNADSTGKAAFQSVLGECTARGSAVDFRVNGTVCDIQREETWPDHWSRLSLTLSRRTAPEVRDGNAEKAAESLQWSRLFVAAIASLLPLRANATDAPGSVGFAEGEAKVHLSTRYERDRRNRAAAIAIWGCKCQACGLDFGLRYGPVANGFIEVHHTTPVSKLEAGTVVNPGRDLVPLCPNCHAVAHLRDPPFSIEDIRAMLTSTQ